MVTRNPKHKAAKNKVCVAQGFRNFINCKCCIDYITVPWLIGTFTPALLVSLAISFQNTERCDWGLLGKILLIFCGWILLSFVMLIIAVYLTGWMRAAIRVVEHFPVTRNGILLLAFAVLGMMDLVYVILIEDNHVKFEYYFIFFACLILVVRVLVVYVREMQGEFKWREIAMQESCELKKKQTELVLSVMIMMIIIYAEKNDIVVPGYLLVIKDTLIGFYLWDLLEYLIGFAICRHQPKHKCYASIEVCHK